MQWFRRLFGRPRTEREGREEDRSESDVNRQTDSALDASESPASEPEPTCLDDVRARVTEALLQLPVSAEESLRGQIRWIADRWRVGSSRIIEGTADEIESALFGCFAQDLQGETFYFEMNTDTDGWTGVAHNVYFRCGRGMHHVGRYADGKYIAVFHRRL